MRHGKSASSYLLVDVGNTHTHLARTMGSRVVRTAHLPTALWQQPQGAESLRRWVGRGAVRGAALCSVVPPVTQAVTRAVESICGVSCSVLTWRTAAGLRFNYRHPETIGADRLANAIGLLHRVGAPALAVDFGTAVTVEVIDRRGCFVGGLIAPGLGLFTDYLHDRTAKLPKIRLGPMPRGMGRNTVESMTVAAVHGFPAMMEGLIRGVLRELGEADVPVIATGGYARNVARRIPSITRVVPSLTFEGLRVFCDWTCNRRQIEQRASARIG